MNDMPPPLRSGRAGLSSLRARLRGETAGLHARLDALAEFSDLGSYRRYLRGTARFRRAVEAAFAGMPADADAWRAREIADLVAADLADLGMAGAAAPLAPPAVPGASEAYGMFYVVEGSALGAHVLSGRAAELGLGAGFGARHLAAQTGERGRWSRFVARLDTDPGIDPEAAGRGARAAFDLALAAYSGGTA